VQFDLLLLHYNIHYTVPETTQSRNNMQAGGRDLF